MTDKKSGKAMKIVCTMGVIIFLAAVFTAIYIMAKGIGHVPGIDFGPGQYYYTDIPGWQKYFLPAHYENHVPMAVLIGLFFAWGYLMYRLWVFVDRKWK